MHRFVALGSFPNQEIECGPWHKFPTQPGALIQVRAARRIIMNIDVGRLWRGLLALEQGAADRRQIAKLSNELCEARYFGPPKFVAELPSPGA